VRSFQWFFWCGKEPGFNLIWLSPKETHCFNKTLRALLDFHESLSTMHLPLRSAALIIALTTSAIVIIGNLAGAVFLPAIPKELRVKPQMHSESG
jgi:hypothetical protein